MEWKWVVRFEVELNAEEIRAPARGGMDDNEVRSIVTLVDGHRVLEALCQALIVLCMLRSVPLSKSFGGSASVVADDLRRADISACCASNCFLLLPASRHVPQMYVQTASFNTNTEVRRKKEEEDVGALAVQKIDTVTQQRHKFFRTLKPQSLGVDRVSFSRYDEIVQGRATAVRSDP